MEKKFKQTIPVLACIYIHFDQSAKVKVFAETKSTEEDISDEIEWMEEKDELEK